MLNKACFNRTFMELKFGWSGSVYLVNLRFNRTFMELKSHSNHFFFKLLKF